MFRSGEAAFEADTYYDRMPNYSAVPIISITLINRAVSEWNVRTNVRVCTSRDLCICNRPPCHQFAILIFTRASISRWPRSRDVSCTLIRLNWIYPIIFLFFFFFVNLTWARQIPILSRWKIFLIFFFSLFLSLSFSLHDKFFVPRSRKNEARVIREQK